jgi:hypothetical protein
MSVDRPVRSGRRLRATFLALIAAQTVHSVEEYRGRLFDVFPPARLVTSAISTDRERGFLIINVALIAFGVCCALGPVRRRGPAAAPYIWCWAALELMNGAGHTVWSIAERRYTPGIATAPALIAISLALAWQLRAQRATPASPRPRPISL